MIGDLGKFKVLKAVRESPHGLYLLNKEEEILLPNKYCEGYKVDDEIDVFLYKDSEDRPVATTEIPYLSVSEIKPLEVVELVPFGAFVDMGLEKHLLVPKTEMLPDMQVGARYLIKLMVDFRTERLIGVAKIEAFSTVPETIEINQALRGYVYQKTELGFKIWVDQGFIGLVYHNQIFEPLAIGDQVNCWVDEIRDDGKVDLRLKQGGMASMEKDAETLLEYLKAHEGVSSITDKSSPDSIKDEFGMSKKAFKRAVGILYKQKLIILAPDKIELA